VARAKRGGHLDPGRLLRDSYGSQTLGVLSAVIGIVFLLPYLQLQITGWSWSFASRPRCRQRHDQQRHSLPAGIAFVLWSGLHGVARLRISRRR